jgi:hypothetical protein
VNDETLNDKLGGENQGVAGMSDKLVFTQSSAEGGRRQWCDHCAKYTWHLEVGAGMAVPVVAKNGRVRLYRRWQCERCTREADVEVRG